MSVIFGTPPSTTFKVPVLCLENIDEEAEKHYKLGHKVFVVACTADWCGHCKALKPEFQKAAEEASKDYKRFNHSVFFAYAPSETASTSGTDEENRNVLEQKMVKGFPTIFVYVNSKKLNDDYRGDRKSDALLNFVDQLLFKA